MRQARENGIMTLYDQYAELTRELNKRECESCGGPAQHVDPDGGTFCRECAGTDAIVARHVNHEVPAEAIAEKMVDRRPDDTEDDDFSLTHTLGRHSRFFNEFGWIYTSDHRIALGLKRAHGATVTYIAELKEYKVERMKQGEVVG